MRDDFRHFTRKESLDNYLRRRFSGIDARDVWGRIDGAIVKAFLLSETRGPMLRVWDRFTRDSFSSAGTWFFEPIRLDFVLDSKVKGLPK